MSLAFDALEGFYEHLARALDDVPAGQRELFLSKLCLLMARDASDGNRLRDHIQTAACHLQPD